MLEDPTALGTAVETAFFKHVYTRYYRQSIGLSSWRGGKKGREVDLIADVEGRLVPFEVKYRANSTGARAQGAGRVLRGKESRARALVIGKKGF